MSAVCRKRGRTKKFLKLSASLFLILSNLAGPGVGGGSDRSAEYETCRFGLLIYRTLQVPAKGAAQAAPLTPLGPSFSCWKKRKQKTIQGDYCPLENPLLGSALAASPDPTAGILSGNNRHIESQRVRFLHRKTLLFVKLPQLSYNCPAS